MHATNPQPTRWPIYVPPLSECSFSGWSRATYGTQSVDLTWTYSNRQDLADLLRRTRRWVNEDRQEPAKDQQPSVRAKSNSAVPRRVVDRLGEDAVCEIVEARRAGVPLKEVAKQYGISESSVKRVLRIVTRDKYHVEVLATRAGTESQPLPTGIPSPVDNNKDTSALSSGRPL